MKKCNPGNRTGNVHRQTSGRQDGRNDYGGEREGAGTTFTVTLLFEGPKEQECKKIEEGDQSADITGMRVLLAEDNELNMEIAETF